jgi:hypothetical protein
MKKLGWRDIFRPVFHPTIYYAKRPDANQGKSFTGVPAQVPSTSPTPASRDPPPSVAWNGRD